MSVKKTILIICGGGPAPGINSVISTVAKVFLKDGYRVLGLHEGFKGLFSEEPEIKEINFALADKFVEFGEQNDMHIHGHTLIWHSQAPDCQSLTRIL